MKDSSTDWNVECKPSGRDGYLFYHEASREIPFYWEYGGGDVVVIVRLDEPSTWDRQYPWAIARKHEIFERVAHEIIRQQAPACRADIDDEEACTYVRGQKSP